MVNPRFAGVTILVVEDHEDSRDAMRLFLESLGARVLLARDGREALEVLEVARPDITLCDLQLPGLDGHLFMERVATRAELPRMRVLAVSGHGEPAAIQRTWAAGFDGHLVKPVDHEVLVATLERLLWSRFPAATARPRRRRTPPRRRRAKPQ